MLVRQERRKSVLNEFKKCTHCCIKIISPIWNSIPRISHWITLVNIVKEAKQSGLDYFIFCEDDHCFTTYYNNKIFDDTLNEARKLNADLLLGGISWMDTPIQISNNLFWVKKFNGLQFAVIFNSFYERILNSNFKEEDIISEINLSKLSDNIFVMYPFISIQKEFGYSDVTLGNEKKGYVEGLFKNTQMRLDILNKAKHFYDEL